MGHRSGSGTFAILVRKRPVARTYKLGQSSGGSDDRSGPPPDPLRTFQNHLKAMMSKRPPRADRSGLELKFTVFTGSELCVYDANIRVYKVLTSLMKLVKNFSRMLKV